MKVKPLFSAKVGTVVFRRGIVADYPENTINFLKNCKLKDGSEAYPMEVIKEPKKAVKPAAKAKKEVEKQEVEPPESDEHEKRKNLIKE